VHDVNVLVCAFSAVGSSAETLRSAGPIPGSPRRRTLRRDHLDGPSGRFQGSSLL